MKRRGGYLVLTASGKKGRTYHDKGLINSKLPVYLADNKGFKDHAILCDPTTVKMRGFID